MKRFFVILVLFCSILASSAAEMLDVDYNFIDTAFDGIKPITDKQFNDTINKLTPRPVENTFSGRLKAFLFGRKYGVEQTPQIKQEPVDTFSETQAIQELKSGIYYIRLVVSLVGEGGKIIPLGNYKIQQKMINNKPMLVFYQGYQEYGMLELKDFEDNLKGKNDIAYSRVDIVSDEVVRIVYSTVSDTKCALAKVYLQN